MLDAIAQLAGYTVWNIGRILCDKEDSDTLGTDEAHDEFNFFQEDLWCILEEDMGLIKEEDHLGLVQIAHLWQYFIEF